MIVGSTRPGRLAPVVAEWVAADPPPAIELVMIDLADVDLELLQEPVPAAWRRYERPQTVAWSRLIGGLDAFVLVTPEYNHSTSAVLKNAMDHLHAEWQDKPVAFVGYGVDGGVRAVEHLRTICAELGMAGVGPQVALRLFEDFVGEGDDRRCVAHERQLSAKTRMIDGLVRWADALRPLRDGDGGAPGRPRLDRPELHAEALAATERLVAELQGGLDEADAARYDASFAQDVLWGTPYGRTHAEFEPVGKAHEALLAAGVAPASRYELVQLRALQPDVVVAHVRRDALQEGGFSEMALYVLVRKHGSWWLAAGQNTPIAEPPGQATAG